MKRRWSQFHLRTALLATLVAGIVLALAVPYIRRRMLGITPELERIDHADPDADADSAFKKSDYRFLGLTALGLSVPGISPALQEKYGVKIIDGTSDCIQSDEHLRLQFKAGAYAARYNALLLKKIESAAK